MVEQVADLRKELKELENNNSIEAIGRSAEILKIMNEMGVDLSLKSTIKLKEDKNMDKKQEILRLTKVLEDLNAEVDSLDSEDETKGTIGDEVVVEEPTEKFSSKGLKIERADNGLAIYRDYSEEDFDTSKLKRLVRD